MFIMKKNSGPPFAAYFCRKRKKENYFDPDIMNVSAHNLTSSTKKLVQHFLCKTMDQPELCSRVGHRDHLLAYQISANLRPPFSSMYLLTWSGNNIKKWNYLLAIGSLHCLHIGSMVLDHVMELLNTPSLPN